MLSGNRFGKWVRTESRFKVSLGSKDQCALRQESIRNVTRGYEDLGMDR
jgi:hypothetical protein